MSPKRSTLDPELDAERLGVRLNQIRELLGDGEWRTVAEIVEVLGGSPTGVSAQIRDLRKPKNGAYRIASRRRGDPSEALWEYRMEKHHPLVTIADRWIDCDRCVLAPLRTNVVVGQGKIRAPLFFIGEAPGETEDEKGIPFVGASGKLLRAETREAGIRLEDVYITNLIGCRPPDNRTPMPDEIHACRPRLDALVHVVRPKAILLLGSTALEAISGKKGITRSRGQWFMTKWMWRKVPREIPTLATFHPAAILRDRSNLEALRSDLRAMSDVIQI